MLLIITTLNYKTSIGLGQNEIEFNYKKIDIFT